MERARRFARALGVSCLGLAVLLGLLTALELIPPELLQVAGQSALRTLAELAVIGCLLAAIGYWNE